MANYRLINFTSHSLQLIGIACFIPFGTMMHLWIQTEHEIAPFYVIMSIIFLALGFSLISIAVIILTRYYDD